MKSLIYVSRRTGGPGGGSEIDNIVSVSRPRNLALGVTGALIATPMHFAQMLEGPEAALAALMASIRNDPRHTITDLVDLTTKPHRDFAGWSLAYHGESHFVAAILSDAVAAPNFELGAHVEQIVGLMRMFA